MERERDEDGMWHLSDCAEMANGSPGDGREVWKRIET